MKSSKFLVIFVIAVVCLLGLQVVWLYNTYQLHLSEIKNTSNKIFVEALNKEMEIRFAESDKKKKEFPDGVTVVRFDASYKDNGIMSYYFLSTQILLDALNLPLDLPCLDSIYSSLLAEAKLPVKYQLIYSDSTNIVIETAGQNITQGFETDIIPIVKGTKVQAIVKITTSTVFRNMTVILVLSVLIVIFILACLVFEVSIYQNQQYLILLRENFTHALTHDLKTPLSTIHSVLIQLGKGVLDSNPETKSKFTDIAIEQSLNLQAMVNQILTVAYIDKKEIILNKEPIDLPHTIQSLINKFSVKGGKPVKFTAGYDLRDEVVYADLLHLTNAVSNLIDNAIKYSGDSVEIDIECKVIDKQVHIKIKDNGLGISKSDQQKIFERFERGAEIKRNSISGFGLGLNYVKQVTEAHGGVVAVSSEEGKGSEFTITIPIVFTLLENDIIR